MTGGDRQRQVSAKHWGNDDTWSCHGRHSLWSCWSGTGTRGKRRQSGKRIEPKFPPTSQHPPDSNMSIRWAAPGDMAIAGMVYNRAVHRPTWECKRSERPLDRVWAFPFVSAKDRSSWDGMQRKQRMKGGGMWQLGIFPRLNSNTPGAGEVIHLNATLMFDVKWLAVR